MTERTLPGIGLTGFWDQGAPWKVGGDQNWFASSVLTQLAVESATTALPASPLNGVIYIVPAAGSPANQIAARDNGAWKYFAPQKGWTAYVRDTNTLMNFDGAAWVSATAPLTTALASTSGTPNTGTGLLGHLAEWTGAIGMTLRKWLGIGNPDLIAFVPLTEWAAIFARTSTYDLTPALASAVATGRRVTQSVPGRYYFGTPYAGTTDFDVEALCEGVEWDLTAIASGTCISNAGSLTQLANVNPGFTINQGRNLLTLASAPAVSPGDWICIYNPTDFSYSGWRSYYRAGEWKQVLSVSGNSITTTAPFSASYAAADVQVYRMNSVRSRLANVRLLGGTGNKQLVIFSMVANAVFDRVRAEGANYSAYGFDRCVRGSIYDPQVRNLGAGTDDYGVVASNSQHIKIHRGYMYGRRHAVAQGGLDAPGGVPCRDIRTYDAVLSNDPEQNVGAADFHGNVEESSFERCTIYGGVKFGGGDNNFCVDCTVYAPGGEVQANAIGWVAYWAEVRGGRSGFRDSRLFTMRDPQPSNQGILSINGTGASGVDARTILPFVPTMKDCSLYARGMSSATRVLLFINRGATVEFNPEVDGLRLDVDALGSILYTSQASGTAASSGIIVDRVFGAPAGTLLHNAGGATYRDFKHRLQKQDGIWKGTTVVNTIVSSGFLVFPLKYPRKPSIVTDLAGRDGATYDGTVGGQVVQRYVLSADNAQFRIQLKSTANMTAGTDFDASWSAGIAEC